MSTYRTAVVFKNTKKASDFLITLQKNGLRIAGWSNNEQIYKDITMSLECLSKWEWPKTSFTKEGVKLNYFKDHIEIKQLRRGFSFSLPKNLKGMINARKVKDIYPRPSKFGEPYGDTR